jgi:FtsP/CotA-like multicopper oxidase with cupredoxin domain
VNARPDSPSLATSRRTLLLGGLATVGTLTLAACSKDPTSPAGKTIGPAPTLTPTAGQNVVTKSLIAKPTTLDLGGLTVDTWAYGDTAPGPLLRANAGDMLRITLDNQLPDDTTIHWHGIRLRNVADGVPGQTQDPIKPGTTYTYEFTAPDPGTYFFHPHVGVQLDRGLYAPLIIDDPAEPGRYDHEWVVVLDDWIDGTGTTPDEVLANLTGGKGAGMNHGDMGGMDHGSMMSQSPSGTASNPMGGMKMSGTPPFGDAGDVVYPHYLINGRTPADPEILNAKPGQRVRIRVVNAGSDTIFTVALGGHQMTVIATDGWAVQPATTDAFHIGMGERYDVEVTLAEGVFPLVAVPFGKKGQARALVRSGAGRAPAETETPRELTGRVLLGTDLEPAESSRLETKDPDDQQMLHLSGQMQPYAWAINGKPFGENTPLELTEGKRTRLQMMNMTMMTHPMHLHGHTFALPNGLRKDTVLIPPMGTIAAEFDADNPGDWMAHCHNIYHAEAGMMIALNYVK